jgi:hypothetical protein
METGVRGARVRAVLILENINSGVKVNPKVDVLCTLHTEQTVIKICKI